MRKVTPISCLASQEGKDIGVDQVRAINEVVSQHAQQNGNKLVYIQDAERLTEAAANALLKTLEEPRPNTYFLLQTEPSSSLLATIYSRCQVWNVPLPTEAEALTWLSSQFQAETSELLTALAMNLGRPLLALETLQQGLIEQRKNFLRQFLAVFIVVVRLWKFCLSLKRTHRTASGLDFSVFKRCH